MILLDTHAFLWFVGSPKSLSTAALKKIESSISKGRPVLVSSISIWEICVLASRGRLELAGGVESWLEKVTSLSEFEFIPVTNRIAIDSVFLPGEFHSDPADRIIVATARIRKATIITKDQKISRYSHVKSIW